MREWDYALSTDGPDGCRACARRVCDRAARTGRLAQELRPDVGSERAGDAIENPREQAGCPGGEDDPDRIDRLSRAHGCRLERKGTSPGCERHQPRAVSPLERAL